MEISFILTALRQRGWIIALALALGALAASTIDDDVVVEEYRSTALVQVAPPRATQNVFNENLDRYVKGQLTALASPAMSAAVADDVGLGIDPSTVRRAVDFGQVQLTNTIEITATSTDPQLAQTIAASYADVYLDRAARQEQQGSPRSSGSPTSGSSSSTRRLPPSTPRSATCSLPTSRCRACPTRRRCPTSASSAPI